MSDLWHVEGGVKFHFSVTVKPAEMKGWSPARIRAFFEGIAKAIRAYEGTDDPMIAPRSRP